MEPTSFPRRLRALAAAVGGISTLASRCRVSEARVIAWFSGQDAPTADELYVLQLIAQSASVPLADGSSIPPRNSYIRGKAGDSPGVRAPTAERDPCSYEAYKDWLRTR